VKCTNFESYIRKVRVFCPFSVVSLSLRLKTQQKRLFRPWEMYRVYERPICDSVFSRNSEIVSGKLSIFVFVCHACTTAHTPRNILATPTCTVSLSDMNDTRIPPIKNITLQHCHGCNSREGANYAHRRILVFLSAFFSCRREENVLL